MLSTADRSPILPQALVMFSYLLPMPSPSLIFAPGISALMSWVVFSDVSTVSNLSVWNMSMMK